MPKAKASRASAKKEHGSAKGERGLTKSQLAEVIAGRAGVTKASVNNIFMALGEVIAEELHGGRPIVIPGIAKVSVTRKAATKARPGRNPFTGEEIMIKAKPARNVVKIRPVKALKDMA